SDTAARFADERIRPARENYEVPSAAVLIAVFHTDRVEIAELGDCTVLIEARGGIARYGGTAHGRALEKANAARMMAPGGGRGPEVVAFLKGVRNRANTPDGYAIFMPDAGSGARARRHTHQATAADALFVTDGYEAAVDDYALFDEVGLFAEARRDIRGPLAALRAVEQADPECTKYPRFKQSDDATAMLVRFGPVQGAPARTPN
ncbi:MAG: hypothetical protein AAFW98_17450, partial [Pseudomonadota bacterium]